MTESILHLTEHLLGDQIGGFARLLHALVLAVLAISWVFPLILSYARERQKSRGTYWVPMWHCRSCGHFNPPDFVECQKCRAPMSPPWWESVLPAFFVNTVHHGGKFLLALYKLAGWVAFYGLTLLAFVNLRLYSFAQYPLQEFMAGAVMILLLLTLYFLGRAFNAKLESPVARLTDLLVAATFSGFLFVSSFLWAASPFPPGKPLAYVQPIGAQVRLMSPGGLQVLARGVDAGNGMKVNLQYVELNWPLFFVDQIFVTRLAGEPVLDPWTLLFFDAAARAFSLDDPYRPRVTLLEQTFVIIPGTNYSLRRARQGAGLTLEKT